MGPHRKAECLDLTLLRGRRLLERVLRTYTSHYNNARPHRGLDLETPEPGRVARQMGRLGWEVLGPPPRALSSQLGTYQGPNNYLGQPNRYAEEPRDVADRESFVL